MIRKLSLCISLLLPLTSANAALLAFDNRADWLDQVGVTEADWIEDFNSFSGDHPYDKDDMTGPIDTGLLKLSVINGPGDNTWRIEDPNPRNAINSILDIDDTPFAIVLSKRSPAKNAGNSLIEFNPLRAIGFQYSGANFSATPGLLTTSLGDTILDTYEIAKNNTQALYFLGLVYTEGESFDSLTLGSRNKFGTGIDNIEGVIAAELLSSGDEFFKAPNPVPLPAAFWLFASALLGLAGYSRRRAASA